jgi:hypothetical protein
MKKKGNTFRKYFKTKSSEEATPENPRRVIAVLQEIRFEK